MWFLTYKQAKELDTLSMDKFGISGKLLMGNAGKKVAKKAMEIVNKTQDPSILVLCGKGNNGGDGFAAAHVLKKNNYNVFVHSFLTPELIKSDSLYFFKKCEQNKITITYGYSLFISDSFDLIIDGIFGTGLKMNIKDDLLQWFYWVNQTNTKILSIDIPSGLDSDSGVPKPIAIKADETITFGAPKLGSIFRYGKEFSGKVTTGEIGFPNLNKVAISGLKWHSFSNENLKNVLIKPKIDSHKYSSGKVLLITGSKGMTGASILATLGALRSGTGLTLTATAESLNNILEKKIIEGMTFSLDDNFTGYFKEEHFDALLEKSEWADVVILGPGLGRQNTTQELIKKLVLFIKKPLVLDADGLFPFKSNLKDLNNRINPLVITPHLGELSHISGINKKKLVSDFPNQLEKIMMGFNHTAVIKQVPVCIFHKDQVSLNTTGNQGLSTSGTGDVLSGMIGSFIAQGLSLRQAAESGVFIHGLASDNLLSEKGYRGQIASDLLFEIPKVISRYELS